MIPLYSLDKIYVHNNIILYVFLYENQNVADVFFCDGKDEYANRNTVS